jgi:glycosyltransferase involved in cell wall biosynthesis
MRVLQLIDSLRPGGAERMAINYANALVPHVQKSYLCCSRLEGKLKSELNKEVGYLFLSKKTSFQISAYLKLYQFIKQNKIDIVHAHSTSYFMAGTLKMMGGQFKLIWHDHYGDSEFLKERNYFFIKFFSHFFSGVISVNSKLQKWARESLHAQNVIVLKNFINTKIADVNENLILEGDPDSFKIICVANLRPQKDHFNLLSAFEMLPEALPISLHLIGEDPKNEYSNSVLRRIRNSKYSKRIFYYGTTQHISAYLVLADLGVLSSRSEGLPLVLLEYGNCGLPVVSTKVGECDEVVNDNGLLVSSKRPEDLSASILYYYENPQVRTNDALSFQKNIRSNYSEESVLLNILKFYNVL